MNSYECLSLIENYDRKNSYSKGWNLQILINFDTSEIALLRQSIHIEIETPLKNPRISYCFPIWPLFSHRETIQSILEHPQAEE